MEAVVDREALAALPRIDDLVDRADALVREFGRRDTTETLRRVTDAARRTLLAGHTASADPDGLIAAATTELRARRPGPPRRVLNATGVVIHTNLGRAPLAPEAVEAIRSAAAYCDLEFDLATGGRGSRNARVAPLVADACRAPAGFAVNNAAGALVLCLAALAGDREVLVSRGELVEIGGSFRLPEIMHASGAQLVEVGTTNRTRAEDFAAAGTDVALILAVHPSNYRITGFSQAPSIAELAVVARERGVPLVHDVGSGLLVDEEAPWAAGEPSIAGSLQAGADLALASGDKLLGGPQAGLLAGRADLVERCQRHPLARALRLDKLRIAALVTTLEAHLREDRGSLPTWARLDADEAELHTRAQGLASALDGEVVPGASLIGGGSAPGHELPSPVVRLRGGAPDAVAERLRLGDPAVVCRVEDGALWLDPRTIDPADDDVLVERVRVERAET